MIKPIYENVTVKLVGNDGNSFAILGNVSQEMRKANIPKEKIDEFMNDCYVG